MTDRELMQQALDAMLNFPNDISDEMFEAMKVLKARLAQPEPEPVAWMYPDDYERMTTNETFCTVFSVECGSPTQGKTTVALYARPQAREPEQPAQRTWVGLTDEDKKQIANCDFMYGVEWAEAKLREKNT